jgi:putative transposase
LSPWRRSAALKRREGRAILDVEEKNPSEGYRRLTFMMTDANAVAVAPSTVYRVLLKAGRIAKMGPAAHPKGARLRPARNTP